MIRYEGVTFVKGPCLALGREGFIGRHMGVFWTDRDESERREMLGKAYDLMAPPKRKKKEK